MSKLYAVHGDNIQVIEVTAEDIAELRQQHRDNFTDSLIKNGRDPRDQELMMNDWWPDTIHRDVNIPA